MDPIGQLRERVTLQSPTVVQDEMGASTTTYAPVATVWARVTPAELRERQFSERQAAFGFYYVTIRYRTDIAYPMQIVWKGRALNVAEIKNVDERKRFITILVRDAKPNTGTVP